mmetsp:Transcript_33911/g.89900  ORF Transcript_33911/g.89900 Transcript_33911/m.89900 type:complete len:315 (+) Transcript_33911:721-1665(+)
MVARGPHALHLPGGARGRRDRARPAGQPGHPHAAVAGDGHPERPHGDRPPHRDLQPGPLRQRPTGLLAGELERPQHRGTLPLARGDELGGPLHLHLHLQRAVLRHLHDFFGNRCIRHRLHGLCVAVLPGHVRRLGLGLLHLRSGAAPARLVHRLPHHLRRLRPPRQPGEPGAVHERRPAGVHRGYRLHHPMERGRELPDLLEDREADPPGRPGDADVLPGAEHVRHGGARSRAAIRHRRPSAPGPGPPHPGLPRHPIPEQGQAAMSREGRRLALGLGLGRAPAGREHQGSSARLQSERPHGCPLPGAPFGPRSA